MRCTNCGRLSPDEVNVCKFCGSVFDETKPAEDVVPNNQLVYEISEEQKKQGEVPKYFKSGWLIIAACAVVAALVVFLIVKAVV